MTDQLNEIKPKSLLNLFAPPDDLRRGVFGLVCGLSAEEQFMDCVLEQFSGLNKNQRKNLGNWSLSLFLDAHNVPIQSLPGLYCPWPVNENKWPKKTRLMHAKVALLGFGESMNGIPNFYRLIVSTGNWTKESVNNSINLVWYCDYDTTSKINQKQNAKDINDAIYFWKELLGLNNGHNGYYQINGDLKKRIVDYLKAIPPAINPPQRGYTSRFISNLHTNKSTIKSKYFQVDSIGSQVITKFKSSELSRNFIICGSGFFENVNSSKSSAHETIEEPDVLRNLVVNLKDGILTKNPEKWLVLNPKTSGAAGHWIKHRKEEKLTWDICLPKHPQFNNTPYPFHAKYIFIANNRSRGSITKGLLYLGSANLSKQGFVFGPGADGNIEAGVIIKTGKYDSINDLCEKFGIDPENDLDAGAIPDLVVGEESELESQEYQVPPPITHCILDSQNSKLNFQWIDSDWKEVKLHNYNIRPTEDNVKVIVGKDTDFSLGIKLTAKQKSKLYEWIIPVFSSNKKFCTTPPCQKSGHEIIEALDSFPVTSYEDGDDDYIDIHNNDSDINDNLSVQKDNFYEFRNELEQYPLHLTTTLVETIAIHNQQITEWQLPDWAEHLRRTLIDEMSPETKVQLKTLGINFLKPLLNKEGFAPVHSCHEYNKTMKKIIHNWGI